MCVTGYNEGTEDWGAPGKPAWLWVAERPSQRDAEPGGTAGLGQGGFEGKPVLARLLRNHFLGITPDGLAVWILISHSHHLPV